MMSGETGVTEFLDVFVESMSFSSINLNPIEPQMCDQ